MSNQSKAFVLGIAVGMVAHYLYGASKAKAS